MTRVLTSTWLTCLCFFCVSALQAVFARDLKIMGTSSLTGKHSGAGIECKRAIEMWVENVNSRGGVEIKVAGGGTIKRLVNMQILDDESSASKARELVEADILNVDFIWGPVSSGMTSHLLPLTEARQTLLLAHGASLPTIFTSGANDFVVSTLSPASDYMTAGMTKLKAEGASTISFTYANASSNKATCHGAIAKAQSIGLTILHDITYEKGDLDFRPILMAMNATQPDILVACGYKEEGLVLLQLAKQMKFRPKAWLMKDLADEAFIPLLGNDLLEGISAPTQWVNTTVGNTGWLGGAIDFITKFKALPANTMDTAPTYRAASALAMGIALEEALKLSTVSSTEGALDSANVRAQFENVNVDSFYGKLAFAANGQIQIESLNGKPMYTQQWGSGGILYTVTGPAAARTGLYVYPIVYKADGSINLDKLMVLDIESRIQVTMQETRALLEREHTSYAAGNKCVTSGNFEDYYNAQDSLGDGCSSACASIVTSLTSAKTGASNLPLNVVNSNWKDGNGQTLRVNFADSAVRFSQKTTVCGSKSLTAQIPDMDKQNEGTCLGDKVTDKFRLNYQALGSQTTNLGFQVFAHQDSGVTTQYPARQYCKNYEPRLRPWYASAASGPKDVVIVIDVSTSMADSNRIGIARDGVKAVIDTFTDVSYVGLVKFSSSASAYQADLQPMTKDNRNAMKNWADTLEASGGTNFKAGLELAFDMIKSSRAAGKTSNCNAAIIFMSDGIDSSGATYEEIDALNIPAINANIFTFAFGSTASTTKLKAIACRNSGIFWKVADGSDLGAAMSKYYEYYGAATSSTRLAWYQYLSTENNQQKLKAMSPVYNNAGSFRKLLGVLAFDMDNYGDLTALQTKADWAYFQQKIDQDKTHCPVSGISWAQMEALRTTYGTDSVCGTIQGVQQIGWYPRRCKAGEEIFKDGDYYGCSKCAIGSYSNGPFGTHPQCTQCPPGKSNAEAGLSSCEECPPNSYSLDYGVGCTKCPTDTLYIGWGKMTPCYKCAANQLMIKNSKCCPTTYTEEKCSQQNADQLFPADCKCIVPGPPTPSPAPAPPPPPPSAQTYLGLTLVELLIVSVIILILAIASTQLLFFFDSLASMLSWWFSCITGQSGTADQGSVVMGEVAPQDRSSGKVTNITIVNNSNNAPAPNPGQPEMILADINGDGNMEAINSVTGEVHYLSQGSSANHRQSVHV